MEANQTTGLSKTSFEYIVSAHVFVFRAIYCEQKDQSIRVKKYNNKLMKQVKQSVPMLYQNTHTHKTK